MRHKDCPYAHPHALTDFINVNDMGCYAECDGIMPDEPPRREDGSIDVDLLPSVQSTTSGIVVHTDIGWMYVIPHDSTYMQQDSSDSFITERSQVMLTRNGSIALPASEVVQYAWTLWDARECHGVFATLADAQNAVPISGAKLWGPAHNEISAHASVYILAGTDWRVLRYTLGAYT